MIYYWICSLTMLTISIGLTLLEIGDLVETNFQAYFFIVQITILIAIHSYHIGKTEGFFKLASILTLLGVLWSPAFIISMAVIFGGTITKLLIDLKLINLKEKRKND